MKGQATIYVSEHNQHIGTEQVYACGYDSNGGGTTHSAYWPNIAYVCEQCGQLWARRVYQFHFDYKPIPSALWVFVQRNCATCGDGLLVEELGLETASPGLIEREFLLELRRLG